MAGAQGKTTRFFQFGVAEQSPLARVDAQDRGTKGVLIDPRGDIRRMGGISAPVAWPATSSPFKAAGSFALGLHTWGGVTDLLLDYDGKVGVLRGDTIDEIITGHRVALRSRDAHRFAQIGTHVYITNGRDPNQKWDGRILSPVGVYVSPKAPEVYPVYELTGAEGLYSTLRSNASTESKYVYRMSWVSLYGQESEASPASTSLIGDPGAALDDFQPKVIGVNTKYVVLLDMDTSPDQDDLVDRILYRSVNDGPFTFLSRVPGVTGNTYFDDHPPTAVSTVVMPVEGENTPPPVALWCFPFRTRVYYLGLDLPMYLRYSRSNYPEAVPPTNLLDLTSPEGDEIVGYAHARDYVVIFKRRSVYLLTHDKTESPILTPASQGVGAVSDRAIVTRDGIVYFLSDGGIFKFDGSGIVPLSQEVADRVAAISPANLPDAVLWADPKDPILYLSLNPTGTDGLVPAEVWAIHTDTGAITIGSKFRVGAAASIDGETFVTFMSALAGKDEWDLGLWGAETFAIRNEGYPSQVSTDWIDNGTPTAQKRWLRLDLVYVQTGDVNIKVAWNVDWDDRSNFKSVTFNAADPDATVWNDGSWGDAGKVWDRARVRTVRVDLEETTSHAIRIRAEAVTETNANFRILGFFLTSADHGQREQGTDL